jgi:hypothetical protein
MTTDAVIFLGPSAPLRAARAILDADYRPPARHGDVWRVLAERRPRAIGLIDGVFEQVASVWHKELLEAMAEGVHVFGASSMGALRAAELHAFGMRGVGRVFEAFRDAVWTDDDEVALVHGPAETGYVGLCEPMANVRFTLEAARTAGVLDDDDAARTVEAAKAMFYPDRTWTALLAGAPLAADRRDALAAWLPAGRVDQKRADALALLSEIGGFLAADPPPFRATFALEATNLAAHARARATA